MLCDRCRRFIGAVDDLDVGRLMVARRKSLGLTDRQMQVRIKAHHVHPGVVGRIESGDLKGLLAKELVALSICYDLDLTDLGLLVDQQLEAQLSALSAASVPAPAS